ncbi:uncharacterized protein LOC101853192 [Aplysia californica]|uniref:Uncharacterized protein LOC101853192 n=1 Tax=Aplysia californica TaxID=6500 RepID=A0ABM1A8Y1_APLCA|nr:uncharacterized protein LOC101853192 [Aplysia californica]
MEGRKSRKFRAPKLTRVEKLTQGLLEHPDDVKARFMIKEDGEKGRGVFLRVPVLKKDSFVLEYEGEIISRQEAQRREQLYSVNEEGCFIMDFVFQDKRWSIDGTREFGSISRLLNHSRNPNIQFHPPIIVDLNGSQPPRIAAYALRDIYKGEEIVFDYGVHDKRLSWLKNKENGYALDSDSSDDEPTFHIFGPSTSSPQNQLHSPSLRMNSQDISRNDPLCSLPSDDDDQPVRDMSPPPEYDSRPKQYTPHSKVHHHPVKRSLRPFSSGEFKLKLTCLFSTGKRKSYVSFCESLGQPLTILQAKEDHGKTKRQKSESSSVISLSSSDEGNSKLSQASCVVEESLPVDVPELSSVNKVLRWQDQTRPAADPEQERAVSCEDIVILDVRSLSDPKTLLQVPSDEFILGLQHSTDNKPVKSSLTMKSPSTSQRQADLQQPCFSQSSKPNPPKDGRLLPTRATSPVIGIDDSASDTSDSDLPSLRELLDPREKPQDTDFVPQNLKNAGNVKNADFTSRKSHDLKCVPGVQEKVDSITRNPQNVECIARKQQNTNLVARNPQNVECIARKQQNTKLVARNPQNVQCIAQRQQNTNNVGKNPQNVNFVRNIPQNVNCVAGSSQNVGRVVAGSSQNVGRVVAGSSQNVGGVVAGSSQNVWGVIGVNSQNMGRVIGESSQNVGRVQKKAHNEERVAGQQQNVDCVRKMPQNVNVVQKVPQNIVHVAGNSQNVERVQKKPHNEESAARPPQSVNYAAKKPQVVDAAAKKLHDGDCVVVSDDECSGDEAPKDSVSRRSPSPECEIVGCEMAPKVAPPPPKPKPRASTSRVKRSSSPDCLIIQDVFSLNSTKVSERPVVDSLPSRPVGFLPPTSQPQVAVIKPFVAPAQTSEECAMPEGSGSSALSRPGAEQDTKVKPSPSEATSVFSSKEQEVLREIFNNSKSSKDMSRSEIEGAIAGKWDFFSRLIERGITLEQISKLVESFKGPVK